MKRFRFKHKETIATILVEDEKYYKVAANAMLKARKEIEKTALGAVDSVPWRFEKDIFKAINSFKERKIKICVVRSLVAHHHHFFRCPVLIIEDEKAEERGLF